MIRMDNRKAFNPPWFRTGDKVGVEPGLYGPDRGRITYRFG